jgi:phospholipid/cholesterol/gamma-HCH transport system substrate-binding protein/paraquat-inducible protein B
MEAYFEESVQGLDVGSPVKFRGVRIGEVERITLVGNEYPTDLQYVLVRMSLYPETCPARTEDLVEAGLKEQIEKGLRVRLAFMGLTGSAYLEVDYLDLERNPPPEIDWVPRYFSIPSASSTITRFSESLDRIMRNLEEINIQGIGRDLGESLTALRETLDGVDAAGISEQAEQLLMEARETNRRIGSILANSKLETMLTDASAAMATARQILDGSEENVTSFLASVEEASTGIRELSDRLATFSGDVPETIAQLERTLRRLDTLVSGQQHNIEMSIENIRMISENLRELTANAKEYPALLLFGEPPARSERRGR